jgi:hypothetical protein
MIYILIYLVGCVAAYFVGKRIVTKTFEIEWTVGGRLITLVSSIFSWLFILGLFIPFLISFIDDDREASW